MRYFNQNKLNTRVYKRRFCNGHTQPCPTLFCVCATKVTLEVARVPVLESEVIFCAKSGFFHILCVTLSTKGHAGTLLDSAGHLVIRLNVSG